MKDDIVHINVMHTMNTRNINSMKYLSKYIIFHYFSYVFLNSTCSLYLIYSRCSTLGSILTSIIYTSNITQLSKPISGLSNKLMNMNKSPLK